jgi:hypothetical protein
MTDYQLIKQFVAEMEIGETRTIDKPLNLKVFRSHLSVLSSGGKGKFVTKTEGDKLHVKRIKKEKIW